MDMKRHAAALLGAVLSSAWVPGSHAFAGVELGAVVENAELPALGGGKAPLLGWARASVFVFFRPKQEHSLETLKQLARLEKELAGKPVHFSAVVSGAWPAGDVQESVAASGIRMPVLLDQGDALYGKLGVRVHPVVGIADEKWRLVAYQPFEKINQAEVLRARIRRALGEIDDADMAKVLEPARATMPGDDRRFVAKRDLNLGRKFLERKAYQKALDSARKAQERDPSFAAARTLAGQALTGMGRCAEAAAEFDAALALDPQDAAAAEGKKGCSR